MPEASKSAATARPGIKYWAAVTCIILFSIVRICFTYRVFTQTFDEPFHVACGIQWLEKGLNNFPEQPPLSRIAVALPLYLAGVRSHGAYDPHLDGNLILNDGGNYWRNLALARLGTLPFFLLACGVVWWWANRLFGKQVALLSLLLFANLPPVLAEASQATTDMATAATVGAALCAFPLWFQQPTSRRAVIAGVAIALAVLSKFTALLFIPACVLACVVTALQGGPGRPQFLRGKLLRTGAICAVTILVVVWAGNRFAIGPISKYKEHPAIDRRFESHPGLGRLVRAAVETPVPLIDVVDGLSECLYHNRVGHSSYLLGEHRTTGWWYFFPVALAVKTPIGFLLLAGAGLLIMCSRFRDRPWLESCPAIFALMILLVCIPSRIDVGVRHILPIYVPLSLAAGLAAFEALRSTRKRWVETVGILLIIWVVFNSVSCHPDYIAWFNELAGRHPERILAESDLDLGQDLDRLSARLKSRNVGRVSIAYFGTADLNQAGLPQFRTIGPDDRPTGWVALSVRELTLERAKSGAFSWLAAYSPIERIGKTIYLYKIP